MMTYRTHRAALAATALAAVASIAGCSSDTSDSHASASASSSHTIQSEPGAKKVIAKTLVDDGFITITNAPDIGLKWAALQVDDGVPTYYPSTALGRMGGNIVVALAAKPGSHTATVVADYPGQQISKTQRVTVGSKPAYRMVNTTTCHVKKPCKISFISTETKNRDSQVKAAFGTSYVLAPLHVNAGSVSTTSITLPKPGLAVLSIVGSNDSASITVAP